MQERTLYVTLAVLCASVARMQGREQPVGWFLAIGAIVWLVAFARTFWRQKEGR